MFETQIDQQIFGEMSQHAQILAKRQLEQKCRSLDTLQTSPNGSSNSCRDMTF